MNTKERLLAKENIDSLNSVYKEISNKLGIDTAMAIFEMFKGQQVTFPTRFLSKEFLHQKIKEEYDGTNIRTLAIKYEYSEKSIRRIIKCGLEEREE